MMVSVTPFSLSHIFWFAEQLLCNVHCKPQIGGDFRPWFICRISAVSNAIETIDNEMICFIIFCVNCIRHGRNATYDLGLRSFNKN